MDFTMTEEQVLLRDTARAVLTKHCPMTLVRAHIDDPVVADALWPVLDEWTALADGPLVDLCLFLEECGSLLLPGPFLGTVLARRLGAADGTATVAMAGRDGQWVPNDESTKTFVLEADRVDHLIAVWSTGVSTATITNLRQVGTVDWSRRVFEVDVKPSTSRGVHHPPVSDWLEFAYVALAAEMVGTARWLLRTTIEYAKERVQFDVPIGSFQAIQHKLANMSLAVERAVSATYYAAMAIDAATLCAKDGIQIHGGIGYTWEHDLHLYIRRAYGSEHLLGTAGWHHDRLADLLFAESP
jgi:alkylation response protein AidB-like acyl-CoA dehydrogenase